MSDTVITVENLCKKYTIGHQKQAQHETFRDNMYHMGRSILQRFKHPLSVNKENVDLEEFWALKDVSFEIKRGDRVGIIGRNGAGKSTLLKILSRITEPTSGRVTIKGRVASLLEVGTGFHPELTGRENIFLNGAILGMSRIEIKKKFDEIVDFAEIEKFLDTPVKRYSSGMYVRLAFAVAAHLEPEILLVDEVLAVGDAEFQKKCLGKMTEISKQGRTLLFVSHHMNNIKNLCNRTISLRGGTIYRLGPTTEVIAEYMNFLPNDFDSNLLTKRKDRKGNGIARFIDVRVIDHAGTSTYNIPMGSNLTIEANFLSSQKISHPIFGIFIKDLFGQTILRAYSRESASYTKINKQLSGSVSCTFYKLPIMHGKYFIGLWLGRPPGECIDEIENVAQLTIEPADVYSTSILPDNKNGGVCFTKHLWKFNYS